MTSAPDRMAEYERAWGDVLGLLKQRLADGERSLARVLRSTEAEWRRMDTAPADGIAYGRPVRMPRSALYAAKREGKGVVRLFDQRQSPVGQPGFKPVVVNA